MPEFLEFGKHTTYVVSSFSLTMVVLVINVVTARLRLAARIKRTRQRLALEENS
jgi:heme exporter protein CcmD